MRRNMVVGLAAAAALGLVVWAATRSNTPQPVQISTAEKIVPGKTVEKGPRQGQGWRRRDCRGSRNSARRHHDHRHPRHRQPALRRVGADHHRDRRPDCRDQLPGGRNGQRGRHPGQAGRCPGAGRGRRCEGALRPRRGQQRPRQAALPHRQRDGKGDRRGSGQLRDRARGLRAAARQALQARHRRAVRGAGRPAQGVAGRFRCRRARPS